jgi:methylthioribose-1-phosphate isomerase
MRCVERHHFPFSFHLLDERAALAAEILNGPVSLAVYNPAFDVTPHHLIAGIITEKGVIQPATESTICGTLAKC